MSNLVFPNYLLGEDFTQRKSPQFNTSVHQSVTRKASRISYQAYVIYDWELKYNLLRDDQDGRTNFLGYSYDLTQWALSKGSSGTCYLPQVAANQYNAPDGTLTADLLILNRGPSNTVNDYSQAQISTLSSIVPPGTYTGSIYLRTVDGSTVVVALECLGNQALITVTPQWQRFSVSGPVVANAYASYWLALVVGDALATGTVANLAGWGAQVELGASATPLIPTYNGTGVVAGDLKTLAGLFMQMMGQQDSLLYQDPDFNTATMQPFAQGNGVITTFPLTAIYQPGPTYPAPYGLAGLPELIQNTNGAPQIYTLRYGAPELLSSGTRTNLVLQSNSFNTTWGNANVTLVSGATTGPDGTADGWSMTENTSNLSHDSNQTTITITAGKYVTLTAWLKYNSCPNMQLGIDDGSTNGCVANFNIQTGVVNGTATNGTAYTLEAEMTPFPNGWYRCSITGVIGAAQTSMRVSIQMTNSATPSFFPIYTGTSRVTYVFGAQLEEGLLETAYIPTTTAAATNGGSDYGLSAVNVVSPSSTLASGVQWAWAGSFFYRVRFDADTYDWAEIMNQWWELKSIKLTQVKL